VLLEFPLYRLQRRIDVVLLATSIVVVVEAKIGERHFRAADARQVEEYGLDLRDFHEQSSGHLIVPVLWATEASAAWPKSAGPDGSPVAPVLRAGKNQLGLVLSKLPLGPTAPINARQWDSSAYRPVPTVIQAATAIFAGHDVRAIAQADASNLSQAASRLVELIVQARDYGGCYLIFLTGVPGSGTTLAGLQVVHDAIASGAEHAGDIVYLSGNTPLVTVLREALARDQYGRQASAHRNMPLRDVRRDVRARIQHINGFLKQYVLQSPGQAGLPHEHVIVFDEAQRAWDERQGLKKFDRTASEPALLLELMGRHRDWCACICLIGGGQEINSGERGIGGWGDALRSLSATDAARWSVFGSPDVYRGGPSTAGDHIGELPSSVRSETENVLQLEVPIRSFRSPLVNSWVVKVLDGDVAGAREVAGGFAAYPIALVRSLLSPA
jgi:hypothetical protein